MKIISFSATEILPALLNKTKDQTIRPLWYEIENKNVLAKIVKEKSMPTLKRIQELKYKQPRFKVGDKVKLMWNQRSKYKWFCKTCGNGIKTGSDDCLGHLEFKDNKVVIDHREGVFPKLLGTGTITEVFSIEMWIGNDAPLVKGYRLQDTCELARRDGFPAGENGKYRGFYDYFMKYDLGISKPFAVYRWSWD